MYIFINAVLVLMSIGCSVMSLITLKNRRKHLEIFPEQFKKKYLSSVKLYTKFNFVAIGLIPISLFMFMKQLCALTSIASILLSSGILYFTYEEFEEFDMSEEDVAQLREFEMSKKKEFQKETTARKQNQMKLNLTDESNTESIPGNDAILADSRNSLKQTEK